MSTNEEFQSFREDPFVFIEKIWRDVRQKSSDYLKEKGILVSIDQYSVLEWIAKSDYPSQKNIAMATKRDPAALTRMLDLLEQKSYVKRVPNEEDRRSYLLQLTVDGSRLVNRLEPHMDAIKSECTEELNEQEWQDLFHLLSKFKLGKEVNYF